MAIVFSARLLFTDYPFGTFKLFLPVTRTSHMELCGSCCSIASVMRTALHTVVCLSFVRFLLVIVWSVPLRFMTSCDPFGVFKLFLNVNVKIHT